MVVVTGAVVVRGSMNSHGILPTRIGPAEVAGKSGTQEVTMKRNESTMRARLIHGPKGRERAVQGNHARVANWQAINRKMRNRREWVLVHHGDHGDLRLGMNSRRVGRDCIGILKLRSAMDPSNTLEGVRHTLKGGGRLECLRYTRLFRLFACGHAEFNALE